MKELLEKIKELRIRKGLSQSEIALHLDIKQSNYGKLERGENQFTIDKLYKLAELFQVPVFMLFYRDGVDDEFVNKEYNEAVESYTFINRAMISMLQTQNITNGDLISHIGNHINLMEDLVNHIDRTNEFVENILKENEKLGYEKAKLLYPELTQDSFNESQQLLRAYLGINLDFSSKLDELKKAKQAFSKSHQESAAAIDKLEKSLK